MSGFTTLLQKEWRENTRNFKILWIPLVFIIFGVLEPITNHFLTGNYEKCWEYA